MSVAKDGLGAGKPVELITRRMNGSSFDGFDVEPVGNALLSSPIAFAVIGVRDWEKKMLVDDERVDHLSSVRLGGRRSRGSGMLCVTTDDFLPGFGETKGGQVVRIESTELGGSMCEPCTRSYVQLVIAQLTGHWWYNPN